ncbi:hypothetical protein N0K08_11965 [Acidovorax sp. Be4]|uniref:Uncharacterized protein n=1 Tax=Acidovorax bellezanensis TaxID=2976702 RepID=A0ABT2PM82_9BURK|nr:hypothetical protein [Acidovorax sp. Be4]MCT9811355.1 hypothetical protein [Acidovorax sp. Be4]
MADLTPLTGIRLEYLCARLLDCDMIGTENGPFAIYMNDQSIAVFGDPKRVAYRSFTEEAASDVLEMAKELHASFHATNGVAECQIDDIKTSGASYIEAAMKAIVLHHSARDGSGSSVNATSLSKANPDGGLQ